MLNNNLTTYKIWAPDDALWTNWAKPVLFASPPASYGNTLVIPNISWVSGADYGTMVVVDLPGESGVLEGLSLAKLGYRPIPLYNGVGGADASLVQVDGIVSALYQGAELLASMRIRPDAPPAFLLDSNRMQGGFKQPGRYDNRWCVFPQDMPSASYLAQNGIRRIVVRSALIQNDLVHVLLRYQEKGIQIFLCNDVERMKECKVIRPSRFRSLSYRLGVITGLTRNAAGGFGGRIPEATQSSGRRYYGIG